MFSQKAVERVNLIAKKIDFINAIVSEKGYTQALLDDPAFLKGLNTHAGAVTHAAVAQTFGLTALDPAEALRAQPVTA